MTVNIARKHATPVSRHVGLASLTAMTFVAIFALLSIAFASLASMHLILASDHAHDKVAQLQAESGLSYWVYLLKHVSLPAGASGQALLDGLNSSLSAALNGSGNLRGASVSYDGEKISIPEIATDDLDRGFNTEISLREDTVVQLHITGRDGSVTRSVHMNVNVLPSGIVCCYPIASKGPVRSGIPTANQTPRPGAAGKEQM